MSTTLKQKLSGFKSKILLFLTPVIGLIDVTYCTDSFDPNNGARTILKFIFSAITLGGIVFIVMGIIQIVKAVSEGEAAPPNAIPKALGFLIGGIVMVAAKPILQTGFGISIDNFTLI